jgi:hypothetical protein
MNNSAFTVKWFVIHDKWRAAYSGGDAASSAKKPDKGETPTADKEGNQEGEKEGEEEEKSEKKKVPDKVNLNEKASTK